MGNNDIALGNFLGDTKAVLNGCKDHWTLQDRTAVPLLYEMTICVDIRVVLPGAWVAFSYRSAFAPRPELGLEGDERALYGWLLGVRHRFPLQLSPTHWHRVCLRRDIKAKTFSLKVDGDIIAERTVIAQAIPSHGSLWMGCRPRDPPPGPNLGNVELYLFRMWADLGAHGPCEDGTVIGWNAKYWGVTSPSARQIDPSLMCDHKRLKRGARAYRSITDATTLGAGRSLLPSSDTTASPLNSILPMNTSSANQISTSTHIPPVTTPAANQSTPGRLFTSGSTRLVHCDVRQLCSNNSAYYWMPISVEGNKTEEEVQNLVSKAFGCHNDSVDAANGKTGSLNFCQGDRQLQVVEVSCSAKRNISQTACNVVLLLNHAVSVCELQQAGDAALQQAGAPMQARIIGEMERVGRNLCKDAEPSSGGFVRCNSTSSLDDICQSNKSSPLTCFLLEPNSNPAPKLKTDSCSREMPRFCDCTAFCNSTRQFYAFRINVTSEAVNIQSLKSLLLSPALLTCPTKQQCSNYNITKQYQGAHIECHGTNQRLYSCMVILEMSGPVNVCSLKKLLQQIIASNNLFTAESSLTRLMVCGAPGLPVQRLLESNLTWVASDLRSSDVCQPDPTLLACKASETLAVLLTDSCPSDTSAVPTTTQLSTLANGITAAMQSLTDTTKSLTNTSGDIYATIENTVQKKENTTFFQTTASAKSPSAQPILQNSTQIVPSTVFNKTTVQNTLPNETQLTNTITSAFIAVHNSTTVMPDSVLKSTTLSKITNASTPSPNQTVQNATTTATSPDLTTIYNVTTATAYAKDYTTKTNVVAVTPSPINNVTSPDLAYNAYTTNYTTKTNLVAVTPFPTDNLTSQDPAANAYTDNYVTKTNIDTVTPFPTDNVTSPGLATVTPSPSGTTVYNGL
ncbi:uncharacterized protein LOC102799720 [Neolamprologus brichardi]|uniref:uncharacterized protein LOC102799720 n=1 Tax=Neolamprologus brichardi TaxID=32507 RepID=UPI00164375A3|nr:uncharacterized protein LOC102799720 [Neolamprologus brichardi]